MKFNCWPFGRQIGTLAVGTAALLLSALGLLAYQLAAESVRQTALQSIESQLNGMKGLLGGQYDAWLDMADRNTEILTGLFAGEFALSGNEVRLAGQPTPELTLAGQALNDDHSLVDAFTKYTGNSATVLVKQGQDFIRISTSLKDAAGKRAVGTSLRQDHIAYSSLIKGQSYQGYARLFGRHYITVYQPIISQDDVIGVLYLGQDITTEYEQLLQTLAQLRLTQSGYVSLLDGARHIFLYHPDASEQAIDSFKDDNGDVVYELEGAEQSIVKPFYQTQRLWLQQTVALPSPGWVLAASVPEDELLQSLNALKLSTLLAVISGCILLALLLSLLMKQSLSRPLRQLSEHIQRIGSGDLGQPLPATPPDSANEVHRITRSAEQMRRNLQSLLTQFDTSVQQLEVSANSLTDIAQLNGHGAENLMEQTTRIAAAMEELSASAQDVARHAGSSANQSKAVNTETRGGEQQVQAVFAAMSRLVDALNQVATSTQDVSRQTQNIVKVVEVIGVVADQTNLLALNAAIEAARAGEQGRGFAVVADEVRALASRTQSSTSEIGDTISSLKQQMEQTLGQIETGVNLGQESGELSSLAGESLSRIANLVEQLMENTVSIASAAEQQGIVADNIAQNLLEISECARTGKDNASDTQTAAADLKHMAGQLKGLLADFKI